MFPLCPFSVSWWVPFYHPWVVKPGTQNQDNQLSTQHQLSPLLISAAFSPRDRLSYFHPQMLIPCLFSSQVEAKHDFFFILFPALRRFHFSCTWLSQSLKNGIFFLSFLIDSLLHTGLITVNKSVPRVVQLGSQLRLPVFSQFWDLQSVDVIDLERCYFVTAFDGWSVTFLKADIAMYLSVK